MLYVLENSDLQTENVLPGPSPLLTCPEVNPTSNAFSDYAVTILNGFYQVETIEVFHLFS